MIYQTKLKLISKNKEQSSINGGGFKETGNIHTEWQDPNDLKFGWFSQIFIKEDSKNEIDYILNFINIGDIVPVTIVHTTQPFIAMFNAITLNPEMIDLMFINKQGEIDYKTKCRTCGEDVFPEIEIAEGSARCFKCKDEILKKFEQVK